MQLVSYHVATNWHSIISNAGSLSSFGIPAASQKSIKLFHPPLYFPFILGAHAFPIIFFTSSGMARVFCLSGFAAWLGLCEGRLGLRYGLDLQYLLDRTPPWLVVIVHSVLSFLAIVRFANSSLDCAMLCMRASLHACSSWVRLSRLDWGMISVWW